MGDGVWPCWRLEAVVWAISLLYVKGGGGWGWGFQSSWDLILIIKHNCLCARTLQRATKNYYNLVLINKLLLFLTYYENSF